MKQVYLKIQAIFLALMILVVSNSYAITSHFCGTKLVAVSYFGESTACGMMSSDDDCKDERTIKKDCCKDIIEIIEPDVLDKTVQFKLHKKELEIVSLFVVSYINSFQDNSLEEEVFLNLPPPDIVSDILVLYQTFLI